MTILCRELPAGLGGGLRAALASECQAVDCYRELSAHLDGRSAAVAAALCRNLATQHERAVRLLVEAGVDRAGAAPWMEPNAREFVLRAAGPGALLEVALAMERDATQRYEDLGPAIGDDPDLRDLVDRLASMAYDNARRLRAVIAGLPGPLDWDALIAAGTVPALALGAERRLRRPR